MNEQLKVCPVRSQALPAGQQLKKKKKEQTLTLKEKTEKRRKVQQLKHRWLQSDLLPVTRDSLSSLRSLHHEQVRLGTTLLFWPAARFARCSLLWRCHAHSLHGSVPSPREACDSWPYGAHRFCLCTALSQGRGLW